MWAVGGGRVLEQISLVVTRRDDETVLLGIAEPATIRVAGDSSFGSVAALERALQRVGLPASLAQQTGVAVPMQVSLVQLSRLGFL